MWRGIPKIKTCTCGRMKRYRKPAWMKLSYHDWLWYDNKGPTWNPWFVSTRCPDCGDLCGLFGHLFKHKQETANTSSVLAIPEAFQQAAGIS